MTLCLLGGLQQHIEKVYNGTLGVDGAVLHSWVNEAESIRLLVPALARSEYNVGTKGDDGLLGSVLVDAPPYRPAGACAALQNVFFWTSV